MADDPDKQPETSTDQSPESAAAVAQAMDSSQTDPLDRILEMKIPVIVKVVEKPMTISAVLKLNIGSVITFNKDAYQHIDLMVNNTTIGIGQTVKIGEKFGLRITQIGDIEQTIKSLGL